MFTPENSVHVTALSPQVPQSFLDKVASDDLFRSELETDPQQALARFNILVDPAQIPERVTLPDKETLQAIAPTGSPGDPSGDSIRNDKDAIWYGFLG